MECKKCYQKMTYRSEKEKKKLNNRLNIIEGQIRGIHQMVLDDRYCGDILIQIAAVRNALKSLGNNILENHFNTCVVRDIKENNLEILDEVMNLVKKLQ
ncbi:MAG: metal-sensing transcriptional repressor [Clostridia bacterium]|nr:metal-sensing transcriptional repressor [Clostridia bacterium]